MLMPIGTAVALATLTDTRHALLIGVGRQLIGFAISLGLWRIYRRWPVEGFRLGPHLPAIGAACVAAALLDYVAIEAALRLGGLAPFPELVRLGGSFFRLGSFIVWSALYFTIRQEIHFRTSALRLAQTEARYREAELQILRAQVNPHFLFNALGTIIGLAEHNPAAVAPTTHAVADYLRYSLNHGTHFAPLGEELDAMANYLHVEHVQQGGRLDWTIEASSEVRAAQAPTALIQPLVENAIKYGLRTSPRPLRLSVTADIADGELRIAVQNSGTWIERRADSPARDSTGIGLANLRRRLALLCGDRARLEVSTPPGFVRTEIRLPHPPAAAAPTAG